MRLATAFLITGWFAAMVFIGWFTYASIGWPIVVVLAAVTVLLAVAAHRKNNGWHVRLSPERATTLIHVGLLVVVLIALGAAIAATHEVTAAPQVLGFLSAMSVCLIGAGLAGRRAQSGK
ncbi:hypothetical protein AB0J80_18730 [Actinoplanes sp. NPDC049548]|uniref:hypothetical protein n=1 Tax=Actinoplanes sp. NPDC049548 TaxID=3155152 RepID=UPI0034146877